FGTFYILDVSGLLQKQIPGGWQNLASNVSRVALRNGTSLYYLNGTDLYIDGSLRYGHTQDFAIDAFGNFYILDNLTHVLQMQIPGGWENLPDPPAATPVTGIKLGNGGSSLFYFPAMMDQTLEGSA